MKLDQIMQQGKARSLYVLRLKRSGMSYRGIGQMLCISSTAARRHCLKGEWLENKTLGTQPVVHCNGTWHRVLKWMPE